jgi:glutathione S-transferase
VRDKADASDVVAPARILFGRASSVNVQKVLWLLAELGLPYDHRPVGGAVGGRDDPAFTALSPHGLVPVLVEDGLAVWESHAILRFLADSADRIDLYPKPPRERALGEMWLDWGATTLWPSVRPLFRDGYLARTDVNWDDPAWTAARETLVQRLSVMASAFCGDASASRFNLADIALGVMVNRLRSIGLESDLPPKVADWHARLRSRPVFAVVALSEANLREQR